MQTGYGSGDSSRTDLLIEQSLKDYYLQGSNGRTPQSYRAFYISKDLLVQQGISVAEENHKRPILLLGGSSLPLSALKDLISFILTKGIEVASIDYPIGGPFDIRIDPVRERPEALREFLEYLKQTERVQGIDVVAQSYAAFEVVRVLTADPSCGTLIKSIILVNPPGFDLRNNLFKHSFRFLYNHLFKGSLVSLAKGLRFDFVSVGDDSPKRFIRSEISGNSLWARKTFVNLFRTLRELRDITSFRIKEPLIKLKNQGSDFHLFLQEDDQLVPVKITLEEVKDFLPEQNVRIVPGGHNDLFFQRWQRDAFFDFVQEVRSK